MRSKRQKHQLLKRSDVAASPLSTVALFIFVTLWDKYNNDNNDNHGKYNDNDDDNDNNNEVGHLLFSEKLKQKTQFGDLKACPELWKSWSDEILSVDVDRNNSKHNNGNGKTKN